jgi:transcriptional regulator with XRE-family HTH domain
MRIVRTSRYKKSDARGARTLGLLVRGNRQALGMSQTDLALKVGIRRGSLSLIEHDRRRPSATLLYNIADILNIKPERLFLLAGPEAKLAMRRCFGSRTTANEAAWLTFTRDKALLARHNVQSAELRLLSKIRIIGEVHDPRDFIYILTAIRQALQS